jgi:hypothetical protein
MRKVWVCNFCFGKIFVKKGNLIRHLTSTHRKQRYPKDQTLKSAFDIANDGERIQVITTKGDTYLLPID